MRIIESNGESKLKQKLSTSASRDNGIKTDVAVVVIVVVVAVNVVYTGLCMSSITQVHR